MKHKHASDSAPRERLLDVALRLVRDDPNATLTAVAEAAGVSRATVHRHLKSKAWMLERLQDERGLDLAQRSRRSPRDRILDALAALLRETGLVGTSLEQVAKRAGVGPATLYRQFGDRAGLLRAYASERSPRRLVAILDADGPLREQLLAITEEGIGFIRTHAGLVKLLLSDDPELRGLLATLSRDPASTRTALVRFLAARVDRGELRQVDPFVMAHCLLGAIAACAIATRTPGDDAAVAPLTTEQSGRLAAQIVDGFLAGWACPEHSP